MTSRPERPNDAIKRSKEIIVPSRSGAAIQERKICLPERASRRVLARSSRWENPQRNQSADSEKLNSCLVSGFDSSTDFSPHFKPPQQKNFNCTIRCEEENFHSPRFSHRHVQALHAMPPLTRLFAYRCSRFALHRVYLEAVAH